MATTAMKSAGPAAMPAQLMSMTPPVKSNVRSGEKLDEINVSNENGVDVSVKLMPQPQALSDT